MRAPRFNNRQRTGAYLVEFAFVAPIFFLMVLGIVEFGRTCMVMELLTEAARQACRKSVIEGTSGPVVQQAAIDYLTSVGINGETADVYINGQPIGTTDLSTMPPYTDITVVVTVPVSNVTWVPAGFVTGDLSGQFTMKRE